MCHCDAVWVQCPSLNEVDTQTPGRLWPPLAHQRPTILQGLVVARGACCSCPVCSIPHDPRYVSKPPIYLKHVLLPCEHPSCCTGRESALPKTGRAALKMGISGCSGVDLNIETNSAALPCSVWREKGPPKFPWASKASVRLIGFLAMGTPRVIHSAAVYQGRICTAFDTLLATAHTRLDHMPSISQLPSLQKTLLLLRPRYRCRKKPARTDSQPGRANMPWDGSMQQAALWPVVRVTVALTNSSGNGGGSGGSSGKLHHVYL